MSEGLHDGGGWYYTSTSNVAPWTPALPKDPIESATDDVLILELIKRGYAVGRLNDDNRLEVKED